MCLEINCSTTSQISYFFWNGVQQFWPLNLGSVLGKATPSTPICGCNPPPQPRFYVMSHCNSTLRYKFLNNLPDVYDSVSLMTPLNGIHLVSLYLCIIVSLYLCISLFSIICIFVSLYLSFKFWFIGILYFSVAAKVASSNFRLAQMFHKKKLHIQYSEMQKTQNKMFCTFHWNAQKITGNHCT